MDFLTIILLLAGGAVAGLLAGMFGVSAGFLLVPVLLAVQQTTGVTSLVGTHIALGTSLAVLSLNALVSTYRFSQDQHVVWRAAALAGAAGVISALFGSLLAGGFQGRTLRLLCGVVTVVVAVRLFARPRKPKGEQRMNAGGLIGAGFLAGGISSVTGVGGDVVAAPILYAVERFPLMKARGTAQAVVILTSFAGVVGFGAAGWGNTLLPAGVAGFFNPLQMLVMAIGVIPSFVWGERLASNIRSALPARLFAFLLLIIAVRLLLF